jgi:hypothetical protein
MWVLGKNLFLANGSKSVVALLNTIKEKTFLFEKVEKLYMSGIMKEGKDKFLK